MNPEPPRDPKPRREPGPGPSPLETDPSVTVEGGRGTAGPTPLSAGSGSGAGSGTGGTGTSEALALPEQIVPGMTIFDDRFLVLDRLGEGGMGSVWLVRDQGLMRECALKLITSRIAFDPGIRARFRREARVMARFGHPNVVTVYEARIGSDAAYILMEYVRGSSLNKFPGAGAPRPLPWVAWLAAQLCDALQEAHEHQIVHRDLKPSNLMVVPGRRQGAFRLKVLDFGIAKVLGSGAEQDERLTIDGNFLGTPHYASPEQIRNDPDQPVDHRSDLYSVGILLFELLTGRRPFEGSQTKVMIDHLQTLPPAFAEVAQGLVLPPGVEALVRRCLEKDPGMRPASAHELAEELTALATPPASLAPSASVSASIPAGPPPLPSTDEATPVDAPPPGAAEFESTRTGFSALAAGVSPTALDPTAEFEPTPATGRGPGQTTSFEKAAEDDEELPPAGRRPAGASPVRTAAVAVLLVTAAVAAVAGLKAAGLMPGPGGGSSASTTGDARRLGRTPAETDSVPKPDPGTMTAGRPAEPADSATDRRPAEAAPPGPRTSRRHELLVERLERMGFRVTPGSAVTADDWPTAVYRMLEEGGSNDFELKDGYYLPPDVEAVRPESGSIETGPDGWPLVLVREIDHGDGDIQRVEYVRIPAGRFFMGDFTPEGRQQAENRSLPSHEVTLSGFYIQRHEVTIGEVAAFYRARELAPADWPKAFQRDMALVEDAVGEEKARRYPAVSLDHGDASKIAAGMGGRLPTEAQWEYVARSLGQDLEHVSEAEDAFLGVDSAGSAAVGGDGPTTLPVMDVPEDRTAQGVVGLSGNVREWCRDFYETYAEGSHTGRDPWVLPAGRDGPRVVRGASTMTYRSYAKTFARKEPLDPIYESGDVGFRLVIELPPIAPAIANE